MIVNIRGISRLTTGVHLSLPGAGCQVNQVFTIPPMGRQFHSTVRNSLAIAAARQHHLGRSHLTCKLATQGTAERISGVHHHHHLVDPPPPAPAPIQQQDSVIRPHPPARPDTHRHRPSPIPITIGSPSPPWPTIPVGSGSSSDRSNAPPHHPLGTSPARAGVLPGPFATTTTRPPIAAAAATT